LKGKARVEWLRHELSEAEENLRVIQRRKAEYVLETDVPLQIIKNEQRLETKITNLKAQLAELEQAVATERLASEPGPSVREPIKVTSLPPEGRGYTAAIQVWWQSQSSRVKVVIIMALGSIIVATCGLFSGVPGDIFHVFLITPTPVLTDTSTPIPTPTKTPTRTPTGTDTVTTPATATMQTPTPTQADIATAMPGPTGTQTLTAIHCTPSDLSELPPQSIAIIEPLDGAKSQVALDTLRYEDISGLSLASGITIDFKRMKSFELSNPGFATDFAADIVITFLDCKIHRDRIQSESGSFLTAETEFGPLELYILNVKRVDFQW
jgi:hypothetical protein